MDILELIQTRRSVRKYTGEPVSDKDIDTLLEAGRWAPSGLNNQPWRFAVIRGMETKKRLAAATKYSTIILSADTLIAVFLDRLVIYDKIKDAQAVGACIQNMLLQAHGLGLGACWLGQILAKAEMVRQGLDAPESYELMAVVAVGHPEPAKLIGKREELDKLVFMREKIQ
ncbi:MAG: nitroreductase [Actinobacteria bacterium]|nr:nitroreductase [Actinomycetota bacterium]